MGVLRFRDNFKRFPEYSDAIAALRPGSSFGITMNDYNSLYWQGEDNTDMPPTEEQIKAKLKELIAEWEEVEYQRQRYLHYPALECQLALLWDDMDAGKIPGKETSSWYAAIKTTKEAIPKGSLGPEDAIPQARYAWEAGFGKYAQKDGEIIPLESDGPIGPTE